MNFQALFQRATQSADGSAGATPYPFQIAFAHGESLPDVLAVPTGAGKTATVVLGWLFRRRFADAATRDATPRRLIFCLPMRTLVDQTARNVSSWIERLGLTHIVGVHALLGGAVDQRFDTRPEDDAILIGTQDQLLSRALNRGYAMSRFRWPVHFALLNNDALWVLDEVQLMGPGLSTSAQLEGLRRLFGTAAPCHSIWMSATMSEARLQTVDHGGRQLTRLELSDADRRDPRLAPRLNAAKRLVASEIAFAAKSAHVPGLVAAILGQHTPGSRTLVVMNRVVRAQTLFRALQGAAGSIPTALIHSRFRPMDRGRTQDNALQPHWSGILVTTQAIEAGVDISARLLVTELAPWSSLVQRFGRCNREGEFIHGEAKVMWLDVPDDEAAPYEPAAFAIARSRLAMLDDVGATSLARFPSDEAGVTPPVLRRRDLLDFFDTESDLTGHDVDVSPFIRSSDDRDVQVAWRALDGPPGADAPDLRREELCNVAVHQLQDLLKKPAARAWRWSSLEGAWAAVTRPVPGMTILLPVAAGGYSDALGFTGDPADRPSLTTATGEPPGADESDRLTYACSSFVTLPTHSQDVAEELEKLAASLSGETPWPALGRAARWHDVGKAHDAFQAMLLAPLPADDPKRAGTLWAKSDHKGGRNARRHFRHELASALALMAQGGSDLEVYLVAAHHGKVRLAIRSRPTERAAPNGRRFALGVWDGDVLPEVDLGAGVTSRTTSLDLNLMELGDGPSGPSWRRRMLGLVEAHGPFRLAYWETLVRVADWRGTERRQAITEEVRSGDDD